MSGTKSELEAVLIVMCQEIMDAYEDNLMARIKSRDALKKLRDLAVSVLKEINKK